MAEVDKAGLPFHADAGLTAKKQTKRQKSALPGTRVLPRGKCANSVKNWTLLLSSWVITPPWGPYFFQTVPIYLPVNF